MKYISISGAVAAGKSTLLHRLQEKLGDRAAMHEERPQDNPFINEYYADSRRWSFHSQMTFLALYFDDLAHEERSWLRQDKPFYLFDRSLSENLVIARYRLQAGDLTQVEYDMIEKMALGIERLMPPIDKYIYLRCPVSLLLERLRERGRIYESELGIAYATQQKELYDAWAAKLPPDRTLVLDADQEIDLDEVIRFIEA